VSTRTPAAPGRAVGLLWLLTGLFALRVAGQALVASRDVSFLPPMAEWYSGLVPYPLLLPIQLVMLAVMARIDLDLTRGRGPFVRARPRLGSGLRWFAVAYFLAMVARYALTMALRPERRWLGGAIPIVFHWVLAAYVFVWGTVIVPGAARRGTDR